MALLPITAEWFLPLASAADTSADARSAMLRCAPATRPEARPSSIRRWLSSGSKRHHGGIEVRKER